MGKTLSYSFKRNVNKIKELLETSKDQVLELPTFNLQRSKTVHLESKL
jgi:hypothetical protein